jgi:hypothetical protein
MSDQESAGSGFAHDGIAVSHLRVDDPGALATHAKRQPVAFRCTRQVAIDRGDIGMTAGHGGDQDWVAQAMAQELHRGIDRVQVYLRQRLMHQVDISPAGSLGRGKVPR